MKLPSLGRRRRSVPTPEPAPRHQSQNPLFQPEPVAAWRQRVLGWTVLILAVGGLAWWVYGPVHRITEVQVRGTVFVSPDSVQQVTEFYLNQWRWLILSQRQAPLIQTGAVARSIQKRIEERVAVKGVIVDVVGRHKLVVTIQERVPVATWVSSGAVGWLDDSGTIVQRGEPPSGLTLFTVRDESGASFRPAEQVVTPAVVSSLQTLNDALNETALTIEEFRLPIVSCLTLPEEEPEEETNRNTNGSVTTNRAVNRNANTDLNVNAAVNTNAALNVNLGLPCDPEELRRTRPEVDVVIKDGPLVKFDRYTNLRQAVTILKSLLAEPVNSGATVIDLRFGDRVFIR